MRFFSAVLTAVALSIPALALPTTLQDIRKFNGKSSGRYIVKLKDDIIKANFLEGFVPSLTKDAQITHKWEGGFNGFAGNFDVATLNTLRGSRDIEWIEEDGIMHILATQKDAPWGLSRLSSNGALSGNQNSLTFDYTFDDSAGEGVDVYVLDTGIRTTHSEFQGRAKWGATFGGYPNQDGNGHGTHCAATIAGKQFGVAKAANVVAVKVLSDEGGGSVSDIISGVNFVQKEAAASGRPSIISLSLGGSPSIALDNAVAKASAAGIHVIVAAGNEAQDAKNSSPARAKGVVTVGASTFNDRIASFSNFGSAVSVFAPGENVISAGIQSDTATAVLSGTSMATPHVAGLVGYLIKLQGNVSPAEMKTKLEGLSLKNVLKGLPLATVNLLAHNA